MMWLVAPPKIICRSRLRVKAPLTRRSQPSALAASRTASPVLAIAKLDAHRLGGNPVVLQLAMDVVGGWPRHLLSADDGQHRDAFGKTQQRHRKGVGARLLGAAVPVDHDVGGDLRRRRGGASRTGRPLSNSPVSMARWCRLVESRTQPADDGDIEGAALASDETFILRGKASHPKAGPLRGRAGRRNALLLHEGFEQAAQLRGLFVALLDVGGHGEAGREFRRDIRGYGDPQRETLDIRRPSAARAAPPARARMSSPQRSGWAPGSSSFPDLRFPITGKGRRHDAGMLVR